MDRRIAKTRQALQEALMFLLREYPIEQIEIQMITDQADTARVTFYRHYGTKEELLLDVIESVYHMLQEQQDPSLMNKVFNMSVDPPIKILFDFLDQDRLLHKKLFTGTLSALIQQRVRFYIVQQIMVTFSQIPEYADMPIVLVANHMASTAIGNMMWWLAEDLPYSTAYMAKITHWMGLTGALTFLGRANEIPPIPPDAWLIDS